MDTIPKTASSSGVADLDRFFSPSSVAVIGATESAEKIGGRVLRTLLKHGYAGAVYPVNPSRTEIAGLKSYRAISDVPSPVDLALIAVPAAMVPDMLQACADAGVKGAVIFSSGFNEAGAQGIALQQRLKEICARTGIRVSGPNTEGFYNIGGSVAATFNVAIDIDKGNLDGAAQIGIVSQSGGLGFAFFNKGRRDNLPFSHIVSVGNQVDLEIADYLAWQIEQERTKVIVMYAESLNNPPRFLKAAQRAAELGKPIVMAKVGNSDAGRRAAQSHTGALASPSAVVDAALSHHGIVRADDQDQLLNLAAAFVHNPLPKDKPGNRVGIVSVSGGTATWLADACSAAGLEVPELDADRRARIAQHIPSFGASNNPVDVTAQGGDGFPVALEVVGDAPNIDAVIMAVNFASERRLVREGRLIADWMHRVGKPVLIYSYALPGEKSREMLRDLGLHCYTSLQGCVKSLKALMDYAEFQRTRAQRHAPERTPADIPAAARKLLAACDKVLCEYEAKALLAAYGVRMTDDALAHSEAEAVAQAQRLGYPVALKVQSPDIAHKTEARGVKLGLQNADAVCEAYKTVIDNASAYNAKADIRGVLVQKMAPPGRELIAGIINNSDFGPMVMAGLGGIYAEVLDDTAVAPAPVTHATAQDMLTRLRGRRLLESVRGEPPCDVDAVADLLVRLSHLAWDARDVLAEFDVNPVFVHEAGAGITVVDALGIKNSFKNKGYIMNFAIEDSSEQSAFRAEVRKFFEQNIPSNLEHSVDPCDMSFEQYQLRREVGRKLGAKGWLYPSMPKEYGGGDLSAEKVAIIYDELSRIGLALPPYYDAGGRMSAPTILVWGTPEHKKRFLPPICRGEVRTWQLLTEPGAGSDLAGIKTTAIRDGDVYVVNGQKMFVGSSHGADYSWTIVVTEPKGERHKNLSWLMIPMSLPGIAVTPMDLLATGGEGGSGSGVKNAVFFDNVRVPADHLVGGENNGWKVATTHLEVEHGGMGRLADRRVIYEFINLCKERHDGWAIADDPAARAELVDLYIEAEITRLFALRNHWLSHAGQPRWYEGSQYSLRRKLSGLDISEKMLRIAGPLVLTNDKRWAPLKGTIEYFTRDAITALHPGATTDIQRVIMARRIGIGGREREKAANLR